MKSRNWNCFKELFFSPVYAGWVLSILWPWLNIFYKYRPDQLEIKHLIWGVGVIVGAVLLAQIILQKLKGRSFYIITFVGLNILLIVVTNWDFTYFTIVFLFFCIFGFRYSMYQEKIAFNHDFIIAIIFVFISLLIDARVNLGFSYLQIIIFFVLASGLSLHFNHIDIVWSKKLRINGVVMGSMIIIFWGLAVIVPGTVFLVNSISPLFGWLYYRLVDVVIYVLLPVLWLITPVYNLIKGWIEGFTLPEQQTQPTIPAGDSMIEELRQMAEQNSPQYFQGGRPWWLYLILISIAVYLIIQLWQHVAQRNEDSFSEERESLLSEGVFKKDLKLIWENFKQKTGLFSQNGHPRGDSLVIQIRRIYYNFLIKYKENVNKERYQTPVDYFYHLSNYIEGREDKKLVFRLTSLYNRARYREKVTQNEVKEAEDIWSRMK